MIETSSLRRKLLDLAISGRLCRSAECAVRRAECKDRVEVEKCREVSTTDCTDGRAASTKPPLPPGWKMVKLGDVAEVQLGKMLDRGKNTGKPFKYLANVNVRWGAFDLVDLEIPLPPPPASRRAESDCGEGG